MHKQKNHLDINPIIQTNFIPSTPTTRKKSSSLTPMSIAGKDNSMADIPSQAFKGDKNSEAQNNITY